jgi:hypothetical protein
LYIDRASVLSRAGKQANAAGANGGVDADRA